MLALLMVLSTLLLNAHARQFNADKSYHQARQSKHAISKNLNVRELQGAYWVSEAQAALRTRSSGLVDPRTAKNVIMFLGDGMSMTTLAGARTLLGQREGHTGEEASLSFENFPVTGLAKTYCVDDQIADSACSATAYLCGVKNNYGTTGVDAQVQRYDCVGSTNNATHASSVAAWALLEGKHAGVVTNTRITHASPSGVYAHIADRNWENDATILPYGDPEVCRDIAYQLVHGFPGNQLQVILGGGRSHFKPRAPDDLIGTQARRLDGRDLIEEWESNKRERGVTYKYVDTAQELRAVDLDNTDYLLGLFEDSHLPYNMETDSDRTPPLEELTEMAIKQLSKNEKGYFLFVEGGRIDHAHHDNFIELALDETIEFSKAVARAKEMTSEEDTLIVVTSDHSHVMAFNGYSARGNDILGTSNDVDEHGVSYMTLSYTNGPGFRQHTEEGIRPDVTVESDYRSLYWMPHTDFPTDSETHGGEDVPVFALGPQQHMFTGLYEQSQLPHLMAYAGCFGQGLRAPACNSAAQPLLAALCLVFAFIQLFSKYLC